MHHLDEGRMCGNIVCIRSSSVVSRVLSDAHNLDQVPSPRRRSYAPQQFAGLGVEHGLDQALPARQGDALPLPMKGKVADLDVQPLSLALLGDADAGHLRHAMGAARYVAHSRSGGWPLPRRSSRRRQRPRGWPCGASQGAP